MVCREFGTTVAPSGAKSFFLAYTSPEDGKRKQVKLGRFPQVALREARLKAAEVRALVDEGKGPAVEKRLAVKNRIEQRNLGTLDDLLDVNSPKQFQRNI